MSAYPWPPIGKRIVKVKSKVCTSTTGGEVYDRGTYRHWDIISMHKAIKEVEQGMSVRKAAELFNVPKSTLHDRITGRVDVGARSGPQPYLSFEEEEELASFLIRIAKIGYPHTKKQVFALVQRIIDSKGITATITNGWWNRFCQRHPKLCLKTAVPLAYSRAMATDPNVLNRYFDLLEETLRSNGIFNSPSHIFNCDETGFPLNPKSLKVVDEMSSKTTNCVTGNTKSQITVMACTSAAGYAIPPFVIFSRKSFNHELAKGEVPGTLYGLSDNGWMTRELFNHWFTDHFLLYAPQVRPLLLLLDGHSTHYSPEAINIASSNQVILFALPPHTTHIMQPLDRGCFAPLKVAWREGCHKFLCENPGRTVSQYDFCEIFAKAWAKAFTMSNITSSFKVTGVFPFNRSIVSNEEDDFSIFKPEVCARKTGLTYVPLYSPAPSPKVSLIYNRAKGSKSPNFDSDSFTEASRMDFRESSVPPSTTKTLGKFLVTPVPPNKLPTKNGKSAGKVLTSLENRMFMQEKERKKQEEIVRKEERKRCREEKAKLKKQLRESTGHTRRNMKKSNDLDSK